MLTLTADMKRLRTALRGLQTRSGPKAVTGVLRGIMGDLAERTSQNVSGSTGMVRRVDTERYIASWNAIAQKADGRTIGPTVGTGAKGNATQPGDSGFSLVGRGLSAVAAIQNGVPYGPFLENGTAKIPAGLHLARATFHITEGMKDRVAKAMAEAWQE